MNHVFCPECGNKIAFAHSKPNFCTKCGSSTGAIAVSSRKAPSQDDDLKEDETSIDYLPEMESLAVDIEHYSDNVFTFGALAGKDSGKKFRNKGSRNLEDFIDDRRAD